VTRNAIPGASALALGVALACAQAPPAPPPAAHPAVPSPAAVAPVEPACARILEIEIDKSERSLVARCSDGAEVRMRVALGREPVGPKREAGDERTPEGRYRTREPAPLSRFHRFVPLDYPSLEDAERALAEGRLSRADRDRIALAHARGELPPKDTPLGGELGLHGEGWRWQDASSALDWTLGCIAVSDAEIDYLAERLAPGTPVLISP
jgi:murein L,D-transpeptidase YafK